MEEMAPFYEKSHKLPKLEEQWFTQRNLPPIHIKFRGQSLRWWSKPDQPRAAKRAVETRSTLTLDEMMAELAKSL
jgi:hypothetical protein